MRIYQTKVLTPAPQSTSAVPSPVTTRRTSTLPFSVAPDRNAATPHTRHIAGAQRNCFVSVIFRLEHFGVIETSNGTPLNLCLCAKR
jgi:hypothetical protein